MIYNYKLNKMKHFTEQQVDDILKLKFGAVVTSYPSTSYVSNSVLGKIFNVSGSMIRQLYLKRFEKNENQNRSFMD